MIQIYEASPKELKAMAQQYYSDGILSRVTQCYERLLHLGSLHRIDYLRLALVYIHQKNNNAAERVLSRYRAIYKH